MWLANTILEIPYAKGLLSVVGWARFWCVCVCFILNVGFGRPDASECSNIKKETLHLAGLLVAWESGGTFYNGPV